LGDLHRLGGKSVLNMYDLFQDNYKDQQHYAIVSLHKWA